MIFGKHDSGSTYLTIPNPTKRKRDEKARHAYTYMMLATYYPPPPPPPPPHLPQNPPPTQISLRKALRRISTHSCTHLLYYHLPRLLHLLFRSLQLREEFNQRPYRAPARLLLCPKRLTHRLQLTNLIADHLLRIDCSATVPFAFACKEINGSRERQYCLVADYEFQESEIGLLFAGCVFGGESLDFCLLSGEFLAEGVFKARKFDTGTSS